MLQAGCGDLSPGGGWELFFSLCPDQSGAHPASYPMGTRSSFSGGKVSECEAGHSPPSSAKVKNVWSYTATPPIYLHGVVIC